MRKLVLITSLCSLFMLLTPLLVAADSCVSVNGAKFQYNSSKVAVYPQIKYGCQDKYGELLGTVSYGKSNNGPWTSCGQTVLVKKPSGQWSGTVAFTPNGSSFIKYSLNQMESGKELAGRVFSQREYDPAGRFGNPDLKATTPKTAPKTIKTN